MCKGDGDAPFMTDRDPLIAGIPVVVAAFTGSTAIAVPDLSTGPGDRQRRGRRPTGRRSGRITCTNGDATVNITVERLNRSGNDADT